MPRFQSWEKLKYFSEALVCFQHRLFKEQISRKACLLKYLRYGCCRLSSLLLGEKGPQEDGLTPGNVGMWECAPGPHPLALGRSSWVLTMLRLVWNSSGMGKRSKGKGDI